jgi:predicted ATPase
VNEYLAARFETPAVSSSVLSTVYERSEGNPLFMVNVTDYLLQRSAIVRENGSVRLTPIEDRDKVPGTIRDLIERQFEALTQEDQALLETASVAGTTFSVSAVAWAIGSPGELVEARCRAIAEREQFIQYAGSRRSAVGSVTARYSFLHALYQNVIYDRVNDARKARLHQSIGERMEAVYRGATEPMAAELALHFERGGDHGRAVTYLLQAARRATVQSAFHEAIQYGANALDLLRSVANPGDQLELELGLQLILGVCHSSAKGYAAGEARDAYSRARALSGKIGDRALLFQTLAGLWSFHLIRGEMHHSLRIATDMVGLAQKTRIGSHLLNAHMAIGISYFYLGNFVRAYTHLQKSSALYRPYQRNAEGSIYGWDSGIFVPCYKAHAAWFLGAQEKDEGGGEAAFLCAKQLGSPFHNVVANGLLAVYWTYRAQPELVLKFAHSTQAISDEHGIFHWSSLAAVMKGWALVKTGQTKEGLRSLQDGIERWKSTGAEMALATFLAWQADACATAGRVELGLSCTLEGLRTSERLRDNYYDAELYRIRGELLFKKGGSTGDDEAEACFIEAINLARRRKAKPHELRAIVSLARYWRNMGKTSRSTKILSQCLHRCPKGFDMPELKAAKKLFGELS